MRSIIYINIHGYKDCSDIANVTVYIHIYYGIYITRDGPGIRTISSNIYLYISSNI